MFRSIVVPVIFIKLLATNHHLFVSSQSLDIRDVLSGDIAGRYAGYEIFGIDNGSEEDIVYITKRAPTKPAQGAASCSDCEWFTPWDEDDDVDLLSKRGAFDQTDRDANTTLRHLFRRDGNPKETPIDCGDPAGSKLVLKSYRYPTNADMGKVCLF
jgi:hypothetical protein